MINCLGHLYDRHVIHWLAFKLLCREILFPVAHPNSSTLKASQSTMSQQYRCAVPTWASPQALFTKPSLIQREVGLAINVYYFTQDVTKKGMEASLVIKDEMEIPYRPKSVAIAQGV